MWGHSRIHYNTFKKQSTDENFQSINTVLLFGQRTPNPDHNQGAGSSQEDDNGKKRPKRLDFDLNQLPPANQE